ncbi:MAG: diaminopimelate epimerase [Magnetococcales bacterium]|nr:diaminopimelate epimerase [Magnetococcales bacterium]
MPIQPPAVSRFIKMHGLGNDFVIFDHRYDPLEITAERASRLADRRLGVGCDQIIQILPPADDGPPAMAEMRIFNADGSRAEMCGNAARCVAHYLRNNMGLPKETLTLQTLAGLIQIQPRDNGLESVQMGRPETGQPGEFITTALGRRYQFTEVSMGNPHCVIFLPELAGFPVEEEGPALETHPRFPHRTNVEFVQVLDSKTIRMRVWERGAGVTPACGTGACAAAVAAILNGHTTQRQVRVCLDGGDLDIVWRPDDQVIMTGPATESFHGEIIF